MEPRKRSATVLNPTRVVVLALGMYVVSFLVPAIDDAGQFNFHRHVAREPAFKLGDGYHVEQEYEWVLERRVPGWVVFLKVPMYQILSLQYWPAWFANPCLWVAVIVGATGRRVAACRWAVAAAVLALTSLLALVTTAHWLTPHVGYFLWLGGIVLFAVGARWRERQWCGSDNLA